MDRILSQAHWKINLEIANLARSLIFWKIFPEFLCLDKLDKKQTKKTLSEPKKLLDVEIRNSPTLSQIIILDFFLQFLKLKMN